MSAPDFIDTNILVNAYDPSDRRKQRIARELLQKMTADEVRISVQVLAEFSVTLLHKQRPRAKPADVKRALDTLSAIYVVQPDAMMVRRAVEAHGVYGIHFYDAMIVAAAERAGCTRICSEDLNSGQEYFGIRVENPFL